MCGNDEVYEPKLRYKDGKLQQDVRAATAWIKQTPETKKASLDAKSETRTTALNKQFQANAAFA